jgi:hypothetical protein
MEILESSQQKLYAPNLICVGIDRCENGDFIGRVWEPYDASAFEFTGINEMVIHMDDLYDRWNYPQRALNERSFMRTHAVTRSGNIRTSDFEQKIERLQKMRGNMGTFIIQVKFRQHATWQGVVVWAEENKRGKFQSAMELIQLMDHAINNGLLVK